MKKRRRNIIRECAWCEKRLGEIKPYEDKRITHAICDVCLKKFEKELKKNLQGKYEINMRKKSPRKAIRIVDLARDLDFISKSDLKVLFTIMGTKSLFEIYFLLEKELTKRGYTLE